MRKLGRVLVRVGLGILIFVAGGVVGARWSSVTFADPFAKQISEQIRKAEEEEAYLCYRFGYHETAKCRLLAYAESTSRGLGAFAAMDKYRAQQSIGLAYARIATLAAREKRTDEETAFLRRAKDAYRSMGVVLTDEELRQNVKDADCDWDARVQGRKQ